MGSIQTTRYDELLRRTTDQYGGGSKVGEALEDLFPTLDVESLPMELMRASKWTFGSASMQITPAVGTRFVAQIFNPVGSGKLLVVENVYLHGNGTVDVLFGPTFVALVASSQSIGAERDTRAGVITPTVGRILELDDGAFAAFNSVRLTANVLHKISGSPDLAVLAPGTGLTFNFSTVNISGTVSAMWRERVALTSELDF